MDSGHVGCLNIINSHSRYVFDFIGGVISRRSHLQECIIVHTEAKYVAASEAYKEVLWISRLASDMGIPQHVPQLLCVSLGKEVILSCKDQAF